jgi:tryptophanyl-tRNA synthetase
MNPKPRVLSGMQPSGDLHIGNYLGALREWARLSVDPGFESFFCVVDAHAITVDYEPAALRTRVVEAVATYVASGIDPERSTLFLQSDVPAHMELAWYLACVTPMGELSRMTQFKDKSAQQRNITSGLFTYPILMAADVLIYKANIVPVGADQVQHLELAREICRKFNSRFGELFPEPQPKLSTTPKILGLDGKAKMSKSLGNAIAILDPPAVVEKKLKGAFTDPQKLRRGDPGRPEICNVFTMHTAVSSPEAVREIEANCRSGALACGDCKKMLGAAMEAELGPVRERAVSLMGDKKRVLTLLREGGARARSVAETTMTEVRSVMGLTTADQ